VTGRTRSVHTPLDNILYKYPRLPVRVSKITMARTHQTRKPSAPARKVIRRRRRNRRRAKTSSFTSQSGVANSFGFRSKRLSTKRYRNMLWNSSILRTKIRTNSAFTQSQASAANSAQYTVGIYDAFGNTASPFWTASGGAVAPDFGVAIPTFNGNIVVRGGVLGIRVTNQSADTQPQEVRITLIRTGDRQGVAPPAIANQTVGFDITQLSDFKQFYGTPLVNKTVLLNNDNVAEVKFRLKVHSVDQFQYSQLTKRFYWVVAVGSTGSAAASSATITQYWNASFVGDAV